MKCVWTLAWLWNARKIEVATLANNVKTLHNFPLSKIWCYEGCVIIYESRGVCVA